MKKLARYFIYLVLFSLVLGAFIYLGKKDYKSDITDAEKFNKEYQSIPLDNPFIYIKSYQALDIIQNQSGIILMGFSSNKWMQYYVNNLYDVFKENSIDKVYYYDIQADRAKNTKIFREIEDELVDYLKISDEGSEHLLTPSLIFVKDGKIINYDDETSLYKKNMTPENYWNETNIDNFKNKINIFLGEENYNEK